MTRDDGKHMPIILGNYAPFKLITRECDIWAPTLEQINDRSYDYVKLSRLSGFVDIGIAPFSLALGFDGTLILPALPQYRNREDSLNKFNETLAMFLLGGVYVEAMQPADISYGELFIDGYFKNHGGGKSYNTSFHNGIRNKHIGTSEIIHLLEPQTIAIEDVQQAYEKGKNIFQVWRHYRLFYS